MQPRGFGMDTSIFNEMTTLAMCENLSVAARLLNSSPSVLSRHITQAEKQLGVTLFERRQGSPVVTPTPQGDIFIESAQRIQLELKQMKMDLVQSTGRSASIIIGSSFDLVLADSPLFTQAKSQCAHLRLSITNPRTEVSLVLLREGKIDFACEPASQSLMDEVLGLHGIEAMHLFDESTYLMVHPNDELTNLASVPAERLRGFSFLQTYAINEGAIEGHLVDMGRRHGFQAITEILPYDNPLMMYRERLHPGHGVLVAKSQLPRMQSDFPNAKFIPLEGDGTALSLSLFYRKDDATGPRKQFLDAIKSAQVNEKMPVTQEHDR